MSRLIWVFAVRSGLPFCLFCSATAQMYFLNFFLVFHLMSYSLDQIIKMSILPAPLSLSVSLCLCFSLSSLRKSILVSMLHNLYNILCYICALMSCKIVTRALNKKFLSVCLSVYKRINNCCLYFVSFYDYKLAFILKLLMSNLYMYFTRHIVIMYKTTDNSFSSLDSHYLCVVHN